MDANTPISPDALTPPDAAKPAAGLPSEGHAAQGAPTAAHPDGPGAQPAPQPGVQPAPAGPAIDASTASEIDEAMAALGFGPGGKGQTIQKRRERPRPAVTLPGHDVAPIGGPAKAALKGPRVVAAGREYRTAMVVSVGPTDIFLEFGPKSLGVLPKAQYKEGQELPAVGAQVEVAVDKFEPAENIYLCSLPGSVVKADWENLEIGQTVEGKVVGVNKGGLDLEVAGHRAFMPASQVSLDRIPDLSVLVGEKLTCQVSQIDKRGRGNIVLSRRDILEQERRQRSAKLKETLKEGDTLEGTVRKIMPFGAFVDIGGVDGLVHISDLTYDRVGFGEGAIAKHVKEGQKVSVRVLKIEWNEEDVKKSRISLGMKQLAADPFQTAAADIKEGAEVGGKVTRLAEFGAFVELAPGVEGLVHVSEIAHRRINHPQDVLKVDEVVRAQVLKIDPGTRRISLSIKALTPAPERAGKKDDRTPKRSIEEITKETPALRRLRAQAALRDKNKQLKGGFD
jgi:small subunit ribosomal protein S1